MYLGLTFIKYKKTFFTTKTGPQGIAFVEKLKTYNFQIDTNTCYWNLFPSLTYNVNYKPNTLTVNVKGVKRAEWNFNSINHTWKDYVLHL